MKLAELNHDFEKNLQRLSIIKKILNDPHNTDFSCLELIGDGDKSLKQLDSIWQKLKSQHLKKQLS
jgi:hypothetical protein